MVNGVVGLIFVVPTVDVVVAVVGVVVMDLVQKSCRRVCNYFVTRISIAADWLMLVPMLPRLGGLGQLSLGCGGL